MATYRYVWTKYSYSLANVTKETLSDWPGTFLGGGYNGPDGGPNGTVESYGTSLSVYSVEPQHAYSYYIPDKGYYSVRGSSGQKNSAPKIPAGTYFGRSADDSDPNGMTTEYSFYISDKSYSQTLSDPPYREWYDESDGSSWTAPMDSTDIANKFLFYAVTDIIVDNSGDYSDDEGNYYSNNYVSGTAAFVRATVTKNAASTKTTSTNSNPDSSVYELTNTYTLEPSSVSISTTPIKVNSSATIVVSGGKSGVSYTYQYSANGGSWTTIASTSATSYNFTVPTGTTSLQVRVLPYNSLGSGSAVTSSTYTVISSVTYTSVDGVIKTLTPKVCVGGGTEQYSRRLQGWSYQNRLKRDFNTYLVVAVA